MRNLLHQTNSRIGEERCFYEKITTWILCIILLFVYSSCNDVVSSDMVSSNPEIHSESQEQESVAVVDLETLESIRTEVFKTLSQKGMGMTYRTVERHQSMLEEMQAHPDEPEKHYYYDHALYSYVACDPERSEYHSPQVTDQLKEGLFVNEVYDLLGAPHMLIHVPLGWPIMGFNIGFDLYTVYVLDNGAILLIEFIPDDVKAYEIAELERRIPNYDERDWSREHDAHTYASTGLLKLNSAEMINAEELFERDFSDDALFHGNKK